MGGIRDQYRPAGGQELKFDDTILDVSKWREDLLAKAESPSPVPPNTASTSQSVDIPLDSSTLTEVRAAGGGFIQFSFTNESEVGVTLYFDGKKDTFVDRHDHYWMEAASLMTGKIEAICDSGTPTITFSFY